MARNKKRSTSRPKRLPERMDACVYDVSSPAGVAFVKNACETAALHPKITPANFKRHVADLAIGSWYSVFPSSADKESKTQYVLLKVKACAVNPVDAKFLYGDKVPESLTWLVQRLVNGAVCGIDVSGVVVECDSDSGFRKGDEVFGTVPPFQGSMSQYARAPSHMLSFKPKNLTFEQAAAVPLVGLTTLQVYKDNKISPSDRVLVIGASGGTGYAFTQLCAAFKNDTTAVCGSRNVEFVKSLGANKVLTYNEGDVIDKLVDDVKSSGKYKFVLDTVSSHDSKDNAFAYERRVLSANLLEEDYRYVFLGGKVDDWFKAHVNRFLNVNLFGSHRELFWVRFPYSKEYLKELKDLFESERIRVEVSKVFDATQVSDAFKAQMNRRTVGKIVVRMDGFSSVDTSSSFERRSLGDRAALVVSTLPHFLIINEAGGFDSLYASIVATSSLLSVLYHASGEPSDSLVERADYSFALIWHMYEMLLCWRLSLPAFRIALVVLGYLVVLISNLYVDTRPEKYVAFHSVWHLLSALRGMLTVSLFAAQIA